MLSKLASGDINNIVYRKTLIKLFVNKIFLYDDKFTITFNTGDEEVTITDIILDKIESASKSKGEKSLCLSNAVGHQKETAVALASAVSFCTLHFFLSVFLFSLKYRFQIKNKREKIREAVTFLLFI